MPPPTPTSLIRATRLRIVSRRTGGATFLFASANGNAARRPKLQLTGSNLNCTRERGEEGQQKKAGGGIF
eukprot:1224841-Pyramimonas_sp.AAC.1